MRFRSFVEDVQQQVSGMSRMSLSEGAFRDLVDARRQQKGRED